MDHLPRTPAWTMPIYGVLLALCSDVWHNTCSGPPDVCILVSRDTPLEVRRQRMDTSEENVESRLPMSSGSGRRSVNRPQLSPVDFGAGGNAQSALRADSENISPVLRDRRVAHLRR